MGAYPESTAVSRRPAPVSLAVLCGLLLSFPAQSGEWRVSPSIGASTVFTDNANAANDDEDRNSDVLVSASPGLSVSGTGGRLSLDLGFTHERFVSTRDASDESAINTLIANGQAEYYERVGFLDFSSSISRQVVDNSQPVSSVDTGADDNRTEVRTVSLQPFFLHHFGTFLETESRYIVDLTQTDDDSIGNSRSLGERLTLNSGRYFSVFSFSGVFSQDKTTRGSGRPTTSETTATTDYRLRVHRKYSLIGTLGWQNIEDPSLADESDAAKGYIWNVGISAQPNSRSSIEVTYGKEVGEDDFDLDAQYALSSRTNLRASYSEALTTSEQALSDDLGFVVDDGTGTLIDSRTGQVFDPSNPDFDFQTTLFRQRVLSLSFDATRRRNTWRGAFEWERRKDEATNVVERIYALDLGVTRTINSRLSASLLTNATQTDFGTAEDRVDVEVGVTAALTYRLMRNTNASLTYETSRIRSTVGENNFHDNVLAIILNHQF